MKKYFLILAAVFCISKYAHPDYLLLKPEDSHFSKKMLILISKTEKKITKSIKNLNDALSRNHSSIQKIGKRYELNTVIDGPLSYVIDHLQQIDIKAAESASVVILNQIQDYEKELKNLQRDKSRHLDIIGSVDKNVTARVSALKKLISYYEVSNEKIHGSRCDVNGYLYYLTRLANLYDEHKDFKKSELIDEQCKKLDPSYNRNKFNKWLSSNFYSLEKGL